MENDLPNSLIDSSHNLSDNNFFSKKIIFYVVGICLTLFILFYFLLFPPFSFKEGIIINIEQGASLQKISRYLKENQIIRSRIAFEAFVIIYGGEKHMVLGDYLFEKKLLVYQVARRISKGDHNLAPVKVTIPEGFNTLDIAQSFVDKLPNFNKENFLFQVEEGYLFPDTYFFLTTDNEDNVLKSMSDNFNKKITPILPAINNSGKTKEKIIIMASIIEKEAKGDTDREFISGILWKRIAIGMPLQVDAAPDTYKTKGLPNKPIANPGLKAIKAAIFPKASAYLYYLHDKDGVIHYARSFEEHKQNKAKYLNK